MHPVRLFLALLDNYGLNPVTDRIRRHDLDTIEFGPEAAYMFHQQEVHKGQGRCV